MMVPGITLGGEISDIVDNMKVLSGIAFSRNFGKESALCAGLDAATGDCAICLDSDMQSFLLRLYRICISCGRKGMEVVEGVKKEASERKPYVQIMLEPLFFFRKII